MVVHGIVFRACPVCRALLWTLGLLPPSDISGCPWAGAPGSFVTSIHLRSDSHEMFWTFQVEGVAVGFMSVCSRVNMQLLHECFDLGPFHGLCTPHPDDVLEPPQELSVQGSSGTVAIKGACQEFKLYRLCCALG